MGLLTPLIEPDGSRDSPPHEGDSAAYRLRALRQSRATWALSSVVMILAVPVLLLFMPLPAQSGSAAIAALFLSAGVACALARFTFPQRLGRAAAIRQAGDHVDLLSRRAAAMLLFAWAPVLLAFFAAEFFGMKWVGSALAIEAIALWAFSYPREVAWTVSLSE